MKLIMLLAVVMVTVLIALVVAGLRTTQKSESRISTPATQSSNRTAFENELAPVTVCPISSKTQLLCLHNYARKVNGVAPLKGVTTLYKAAGLKGDRQIECNQFSHTPCGDSFVKVFQQAGYRFSWAGENIAYGYPTIRSVFYAWLNSPGHRTNILNANYKDFGSAFRNTASLPKLWTVDFGSSL